MRSWFFSLRFCWFPAGLGKQPVQIDGSVFGRVLKTERNFLLAQARLRSKAVCRRGALAQNLFNFVAQLATRALQVSRHTGFVITKAPANFRKRVPFGVIQAKAFLIARIEQPKRPFQRASE